MDTNKNIMILILISAGLFIIFQKLSILDIGKKVNEIGVDNINCSKIITKLPLEDFIKINEHFIIGSGIDVPGLLTDMIYLDPKIELKNGALISYDLQTQIIKDIEINDFPMDVPFFPHGIDYKDNKYLYIVNHAFSITNSQERIEIIEIITENNEFVKARYIKSFILPMQYFGTINAVAGVDLNTFYFTTYSPYRLPISKEDNTLKNQILKIGSYGYSFLTGIKLTYVYIYCNDEIIKIKDSNGYSNNGIAYDSLNKNLYVSLTVEKIILKYHINEENYKEPILEKKIQSEYPIDNIYLDHKERKLYAGILGKLFDYINLNYSYMKYHDIKHIKNIFGGVQTIEIDNNDKIEVIHLSEDKLASISTGLHLNNSYIFTSSMDPAILVCNNK